MSYGKLLFERKTGFLIIYTEITHTHQSQLNVSHDI